MYIGIDFDNTIVKTEGFTEIKRLKFLARWVINRLYAEDNIIIINTLRSDTFKGPGSKKALTTAKEYLKKAGIKYHYINENAEQLIARYGDTRKIAVDINIDDKNIVPLVSWPIIYLIIKVKEFIWGIVN